MYGLLFAWVPCLPFFASLLRDATIYRSKATGFGAIAGGLSEWGIGGIIAAGAIAALYLLARSFARGHLLRAFVAVIAMLWSSLVLCALGLFGWLIVTHR